MLSGLSSAELDKKIEPIFSTGNIHRLFNSKIKGSKTRGIDGINASLFERDKEAVFNDIIAKIKSGTYKFSPYLEQLQSKGQSRPPRVISIPTVKDRVALLLLKDVLHVLFPERVAKSLPNECVRNVIEAISGFPKVTTMFIKTDIENFYGSIPHSIVLKGLKKRLCSESLVSVISRAIKNPTVSSNHRKKDIDRKKEVLKGVPQGLAISNILAEISVEDFDEDMLRFSIYYMRYVDDIIVFYRGLTDDGIKKIIDSSLNSLGLSRHITKTSDPALAKEGMVEFLGYTIEGGVISVRRTTTERLIKSIISLFTRYKNSFNKKINRYEWMSEEHVNGIFIHELNEKIAGAISGSKKYGWVFYFSEINDIALLYRIDAIIKKQFSFLEQFSFAVPGEVKRIVRAHYEARFNPKSGYAFDYNKYETPESMRAYVKRFGFISPDEVDELPNDRVMDEFNQLRKKRLMILERDVGIIS